MAVNWRAPIMHKGLHAGSPLAAHLQLDVGRLEEALRSQEALREVGYARIPQLLAQYRFVLLPCTFSTPYQMCALAPTK